VADHGRLIAAAVALAACGGPAAAPPTAPAPVANEVEWTEPDEAACGRALEAPDATLSVLIPREGEGPAVCLAERPGGDDQLEVVVATIARGEDGWRIVERIDHALPRYERPDDGEAAHGGVSTFELFAISPAESAVYLVEEQQTEGPGWASRHQSHALIRVLPDGEMQQVLTMETSSDAGEADDITERVLSALETTTGGFYDLEVAVTHRSAQWAAGDSGYTEEGWTEICKWDGAGYELVDTIRDE
jgi:hypothetical protein